MLTNCHLTHVPSQVLLPIRNTSQTVGTTEFKFIWNAFMVALYSTFGLVYFANHTHLHNLTPMGPNLFINPNVSLLVAPQGC